MKGQSQLVRNINPSPNYEKKKYLSCKEFFPRVSKHPINSCKRINSGITWRKVWCTLHYLVSRVIRAERNNFISRRAMLRRNKWRKARALAETLTDTFDSSLSRRKSRIRVPLINRHLITARRPLRESPPGITNASLSIEQTDKTRAVKMLVLRRDSKCRRFFLPLSLSLCAIPRRNDDRIPARKIARDDFSPRCIARAGRTVCP